MKMGLPRATNYRVCRCTALETRHTTRSKAESGRRAVKMPEKKRKQLVKSVCDKNGVTSMKMAAQMNVDSFDNRILMEADVTTYKKDLKFRI